MKYNVPTPPHLGEFGTRFARDLGHEPGRTLAPGSARNKCRESDATSKYDFPSDRMIPKNLAFSVFSRVYMFTCYGLFDL